MGTLNRTIVLVGMMGSGKSSIGKRLATRLGVPFRDADTEIETAAGTTIGEIFETLGEPAFREGERKVIGRLLRETPHVLATGGGAFVDPETRARIKSDAVSVWLRAPVDLLLMRVRRRESRPLLKRGNPRETMQRLLKEREPFYAEADIVVESEDGPHSACVDRIVRALVEHGAMKPR